MHMLYHVPSPELAVRELRRITRPGGRLVVGLNGRDHHQELRQLITAALTSLDHDPVPMVSDRFDLDRGEILLRRVFTSVTRHDFPTTLMLPDAEPVAAYVRSMSVASEFADPDQLVRAVTSRLPAGSGAPFLDTSHGRLPDLRLRHPGFAGWASRLPGRSRFVPVLEAVMRLPGA